MMEMPTKDDYDRMTPAHQAAVVAHLTRLLEQAVWKHTTSKKFETNPHEYSLRRDWAIDADFLFCATWIRVLGYRAKFRGSTYWQWDGPQFFYWLMEWPPIECTILNRKPLSQKEPT